VPCSGDSCRRRELNIGSYSPSISRKVCRVGDPYSIHSICGGRRDSIPFGHRGPDGRGPTCGSSGQAVQGARGAASAHPPDRSGRNGEAHFSDCSGTRPGDELTELPKSASRHREHRRQDRITTPPRRGTAPAAALAALARARRTRGASSDSGRSASGSASGHASRAASVRQRASLTASRISLHKVASDNDSETSTRPPDDLPPYRGSDPGASWS